MGVGGADGGGGVEVGGGARVDRRLQLRRARAVAPPRALLGSEARQRLIQSRARRRELSLLLLDDRRDACRLVACRPLGGGELLAQRELRLLELGAAPSLRRLARVALASRFLHLLIERLPARELRPQPRLAPRRRLRLACRSLLTLPPRLLRFPQCLLRIAPHALLRLARPLAQPRRLDLALRRRLRLPA